MQSARTTHATGLATTRSAVSNGTRLFACVDGRSAMARRFRDLVADFTREIGGPLSTVDLGLVRQAAILTLKAEELQAAVVRGEPVSGDELIRLSGEARRLMSSVRKRQRTPAAPSLAEHLAKRRGADAA